MLVPVNTGQVLELTFFTALIIGLLGSTHCIGMCGGIVGTLSINSPQSSAGSGRNRIMHHLTYNSGRILSYMFIGSMAGLAGAQASRLSSEVMLPVGGIIAGLFMIMLGLYLAGWWYGIQVLEKAGTYIWKLVEPLGKKVIPPRSRIQVFALGLVWGWLPCGLVYSALALAMVSASPLQGAWIMLGFGLGTLPMLLAMGHAAGQLRKIVRQPVIRRIIGSIIILFGVYTCIMAFNRQPHHHNNHGMEQQSRELNFTSMSAVATRSAACCEQYRQLG